MIWVILVLIYLVSFAINIVLVYLEYKRRIYKVGDIIDEIEFFMWCPFLNTIYLILLGILRMVNKIVNLIKLSVLWEKFRNIKLK